MTKQILFAGLAAIFMVGSASRLPAQFLDDATRTQAESAVAVTKNSVFIPNMGQWAPQVLFYGQSGGMDVWITARGVEFDVHRTEVTMPRSPEERFAFIAENRISKIHRIGQLVRMESVGSPGNITGERQEGSTRNYFYGNDKTKWVSNVPVFETVKLAEMYPGVDAVVQFENGMPRYDFIVKPGSDPAGIALKFTGASGVSVSEAGDYITLKTQLGDVQSGRIVAYQENAGSRITIPCTFTSKTSNTVQFRVGEYDHSRPLIIDPLIYSTYLGESGADKVNGMIADKAGNIIVVGSTDAATYPVTTGVYDSTYNGGLDCFITKFNPMLSKIVFSTYMGAGSDDQINAVSLDDADNIFVGGETLSTQNFPVLGGWKMQHAGATDGFVARFDATGSQLGYCSFIGGSGVDRVLCINANQVGELAVGGETNSTNFSTGGSSVFQKNRLGVFDGFLARFKTGGGSVDFSTYIGGVGDDRISGVSYNPGSSYIYFGGEVGNLLSPGQNTNSSGTFPVPSSGPGGDPTRKPYDNTYNNGIDCVVGNISLTGSFNDANSQYLGYLGSNLDDRVLAIAVGQDNSMIVTGGTQVGSGTAAKFPPGTINPKGGYDVFVTRIKAGGRDLLASSIFGGSADDLGTAISPIIDLSTGAAGDYYIAGTTVSTNYPTNAVAPLSSPLQTVAGGKIDMFVSRINSTFTVTYSTYLGSKGDDIAKSIIATDRGDYYVAGTTTSDSLGALPESYKKKLAGGTDSYIAKVVVTGTIALSAPTQGAAFCPGAPTNISWTRGDLDPSNVVKIFYSSDGGTSWNYIDSTDKLALSWNIPVSAIPASNYKVRVLHYSGLKSESGNFSINAPASITSQPQGDTLCPGSPFTMRVSGKGTGKLSYQWLKGAAQISGARDSVYTITAVTPADAANYSVEVSNVCQKVTSNVVKLVVKPKTAVTEQPLGASINAGQSHKFISKTTGVKTTFQWLKDGFKLPGATDSTYTIASATSGDTGDYRIAVAGECGVDTSQVAHLEVGSMGVDEELAAKLRPYVTASMNGNGIVALITPAAQGACEVALTDNAGKVIAKNYFGGFPNVPQTVTFSTEELISGIYWIAVTQGGFTGTFKFAVVH